MNSEGFGEEKSLAEEAALKRNRAPGFARLLSTTEKQKTPAQETERGRASSPVPALQTKT